MTTKPWTPEDEPRLRQEAIERAEAAEEGYLPRKAVLDALQRKRDARAKALRTATQLEAQWALQTMINLLDDLHREVAGMDSCNPQPPTKDQT